MFFLFLPLETRIAVQNLCLARGHRNGADAGGRVAVKPVSAHAPLRDPATLLHPHSPLQDAFHLALTKGPNHGSAKSKLFN
jgi:hypothetical protein